MSAENDSKLHPTIYYVHLELNATKLWEALPAVREAKSAEFTAAAKAKGKRKVEVYGRYTKLAEFEVE